MTAVMQGVRILEVAEHTFVPAASALLADWGAEVVKIEHVERGDAMRGLGRRAGPCRSGAASTCSSSTRTGASRASASTSPRDDGLDILYKLAATCDVFLTNKLPTRPHEAEDRRRRHPRPQPEHHLRAGHRPGRAGPGRRPWLLRLARLLEPRRRRDRRHAARATSSCRRRLRPRSATRSAP